MEKIVIFNANNESMNVEVVRYFRESNNNYFVFSLHEIDAQGHMNIYVTKISDQNGTLIGTNIIDDVEWSNLKTNLQRIIKENRANGKAIVNDLSYNNLKNIKVADRRALKLLAASVDMLNMGYNPQEAVTIPEIKTEENVATPFQETVINTNQNNLTNSQEIIQPSTVVPNNINQNIQSTVESSVSENYKELYFKEKEITTKLTEENNSLKNELNNCKIMISDIKNILSR